MDKSPDAFRTITEVAEWLGTPAHVLRFWESRFSQIKPVKRAGGRRYYRPADMLLLGGIKKLLHDDGTTIKAVQKILREKSIKHVQSLSQPVSVKITVKKKSQQAATPMSEAIIDPMALLPADKVVEEPVLPKAEARPEAKQMPLILENELGDSDDFENFDSPPVSDTGAATSSVINFPQNLKQASEIDLEDIQVVEALYYSLKMVRNNMKRTGAGR